MRHRRSKLNSTAAAAPHEVRRTRAASVWTALGVGAAFLIALIVFIAQNGRHVSVTFVALHARVPLGLALLIAAVGGAVVLGLAGTVRIVQLRRTAGRHRRDDQEAAAILPAPTGADPSDPVEVPGTVRSSPDPSVGDSGEFRDQKGGDPDPAQSAASSSGPGQPRTHTTAGADGGGG